MYEDYQPVERNDDWKKRFSEKNGTSQKDSCGCIALATLAIAILFVILGTFYWREIAFWLWGLVGYV